MMKAVLQLLLLVLSGLMVFLLAGAAPRLVDDTFITLTYARNLVETGTLTWHKSLPPVDGFTSLGHTLVIALGHRFGVGLILWTSILNIAAALSILAMFVWRTREMSLAATAAGLALIGLSASFLYWMGAGLDAVPYVAVFFAVYLTSETVLKSGHLTAPAALALVALSLMRPEGMFIAGALLIAFWGSRVMLTSRRLSLSVVLTLCVVLAIAGQVAWRVSVYGHPLPNTYYAKASDSRLLEIEAGLFYLAKWGVMGGGALLAVSLLALALGSRAYLRALFILGQIGVVVLAGGDPHPAFRFFLPILPLMALDLAWIIDRRARLIPGLALCLMALVLTRQSDVNRGWPTAPNPIAGLERTLAGHWPTATVAEESWLHDVAEAAVEMGAFLPADTPLAATDVGALAFFSRLPILDTHGLNHPVISHLPKRAGVVNDWGNYSLDHLMGEEVPFIQLSFPGARPWTFESVIAAPEQCGFHGIWVSRMARRFVDQLDEQYLCLSVPSQGREEHWHNLFLRDGRDDLMRSLPEGTRATQCMRRFFEACPPPG